MHKKIEKLVPGLPFSNIWIARQTAGRIPTDSVLYLGILNSLRSWNFLKLRVELEAMQIQADLALMGE